MHDAVKILYGF